MEETAKGRKVVVITPRAMVILEVGAGVKHGELAVVIDATTGWFDVRAWNGVGELVGSAELIGAAPE